MKAKQAPNPADPEGFRETVRRYTPTALSQAMRILGNREEAEEAVQDAFLRVHNAAEDWRGESSLSTWLYRIVYNECLRRLNRRVGRRPHPLENPDPLAEVADGEDDPLDRLEKSDRRKMIEMFITRLTPRQSAVVTIFYLQERSYKEVASVLNVSEDTVAVSLARARESLRRMMMRKGFPP
jgi:RNA polymerase sigma factor (sigma-70 family)